MKHRLQSSIPDVGTDARAMLSTCRADASRPKNSARSCRASPMEPSAPTSRASTGSLHPRFVVGPHATEWNSCSIHRLRKSADRRQGGGARHRIPLRGAGSLRSRRSRAGRGRVSYQFSTRSVLPTRATSSGSPFTLVQTPGSSSSARNTSSSACSTGGRGRRCEDAECGASLQGVARLVPPAAVALDRTCSQESREGSRRTARVCW